MAWMIKGKRGYDKVDFDKVIDDIHEIHPAKLYKHLNWVYLYAMYLGHQYQEVDWDENILKEMDIESNARSIYNLAAGFVDVYRSKMLARDPIPSTIPTSPHSKDIMAARVGSVALKYWWEKKDLRQVLHDTLFWATVVGSGFIKCYWNKDSDLAISLGQETVKEGEVCVEARSPFMFYPDLAAKTINGHFPCRWCIDTYILPVDTVKRIFPTESKGIKGEANFSLYRSILASYTGDISELDTSKHELAEENVLVREYWERAVGEHDAGAGKGKGLFKIRAGGVTLYEGPNPYDEALPFFEYHVNKTPDSFWGWGLMHKILTPQQDLNRITSQTMNNIDWLGNTKILNPRECAVDEGAFTKEEGEVVEYNAEGGMEPHQLIIQPFQPQVLQFRDITEQAMMHVTGFHELSFAQLPERSSQTSGRVTDTLVQAEATRFASDVVNLRKTIEDVATFYLELAQHHYDMQKSAAIMGPFHRTEIAAFRGADLKGNYEVRVDVGSGFGLSPAAKMEKLEQLWDRDIIQDPEVILRNMEFGTLENVYGGKFANSAKAERHLRMIVEEGKSPQISEFDDHETMFQVFVDFIRQPEYDELSEEQRKLMEAYMRQHQQYIMEKQMRQQQQSFNRQPGATQGQMDEAMGQATGQPTTSQPPAEAVGQSVGGA